MRPASIPPADPQLQARVASTLESIEKLERFLNESAFIPVTQEHRGQIVLALLSKALTVGRAICCLVQSGFGDEAFGVSRTLIDIYLIVRYIANDPTAKRAERFAMFFAKDTEGWQKVIPKYYPSTAIPDTPERRQLLTVAKNYKNPHDWSGEPEKTKSLAKEPDAYEFDSAGKGTTAEFDYEIMFKYTSHFVHSTVCALDNHLTERGDVFQIRARWNPRRKARLAIFNVLAMTNKIFISGFRALHQDQPDEILQEVFAKMKATNIAVLVVGADHALQRHQDNDPTEETFRNDWDNRVREIIEERKIDLIAEEAGDDKKAWDNLREGEEMAAVFRIGDERKVADHPVPPIAKIVADELKITHVDIDVDIRADDDQKKIEERSEAMVQKVVDSVGEARSVLVIVGEEHLEGVVERLRKRHFDVEGCCFPG